MAEKLKIPHHQTIVVDIKFITLIYFVVTVVVVVVDGKKLFNCFEANRKAKK